MRRVHVALASTAMVALLAVVQVVGVAHHALTDDGRDAAAGDAGGVGTGAGAGPRTVAAYEGLGAWVDVYDVGAAGGHAVTPDDVDAMAVAGVRTLYLQAARDDGTGRPGLDAPALAARFLARAHERGLRVVGWYVPRFEDVERDLAHLRAIADFSVLGHRFDGVAVDIEWTDGVADHAERSDRLVELSRALDDHVGSDVVGAIVMPPVHLEVVNPGFWPGFPWDDLAGLYDAWLPMGYWSDRTIASGYRDAAAYTTENLRRLRDHLGDDAPVHAIGGLAEHTTAADIDAFVAAARAEGAIGASIYDWATFPPEGRGRLARSLHG